MNLQPQSTLRSHGSGNSNFNFDFNSTQVHFNCIYVINKQNTILTHSHTHTHTETCSHRHAYARKIMPARVALLMLSLFWVEWTYFALTYIALFSKQECQDPAPSAPPILHSFCAHFEPALPLCACVFVRARETAREYTVFVQITRACTRKPTEATTATAEAAAAAACNN